MAYVHMCDRCNCKLKEDAYVVITVRCPPRYSNTYFDLCQDCFNEVEKIITNKNAGVSLPFDPPRV